MNLKRRKWWYDYTDTCKFIEKEIDDTVKPAAAVVDNSERWCYGLGLMRQGGEGQASHSYPLDPAWMQRSEVTWWRTICSIIAWLRQQWPPRVQEPIESISFESLIRTSSRRRRPHLLLTWRWSLGGSGSMTSTVSTEWPRHAACQTDSRLWLLEE